MDWVQFFSNANSKNRRGIVWLRDSKDLDSLKKKFSRDFVVIGLAKSDDRLFSQVQSAGFEVVVKANSTALAFWGCQKKAKGIWVELNSPKPVLDLATCRIAARNNVMIVLALSDFWSASKTAWPVLFKNAFWVSRLCQKAKAGFKVVSAGRNESEVRTSKERAFFGKWLGAR